jgi:hypothetical protein
MTVAGSCPSGRLTLVEPARVHREHVDRARHIPSSTVRSARMKAYGQFVAHWPRLEDFFAAPLRQRLFDAEDYQRGQHPHGGASVAMPYLCYLSLVHGIGLDYELLLGRTFTSPFTTLRHCGGLGVDVELFDRHVARLVQLGYSPTGARHQLLWPLGRMLLHRGDPDLNALTMDDLDELRRAIDAFTARLRLDPVREFYARPRAGQPAADSAGDYFRTRSRGCTPRMCCCFISGKSTRHPPRESTRGAGLTASRRSRRHRRSAWSSSATFACT